MQPIYLVCGVSGSGKTWVCKQVRDKFNYIPHDEHYENHDKVVLMQARKSKLPIITECPFGERLLRDKLISYGLTVHPFFVVEPPDVVAKRYLEREKKEITKSAYTRAGTILNRALEWKAPFGNSNEILEKLKNV